VKEKTGSKNREVEDDKIVEASKYNPRYPWPWPWHMSRKTFELCHKIKKEARFTELRAGIIEEVLTRPSVDFPSCTTVCPICLLEPSTSVSRTGF